MQGRGQRRPAVKKRCGWFSARPRFHPRARRQGVLGERRIVGAEEEASKLFLCGEEDRVAVYQLARPGQSINVKNQDGDVEFSG
jgi:hypothetical protein